MNKLTLLFFQQKIKERVPEFEIRFQDESKFMKLLQKLAFFNPNLKNYVVVLGKKVYWPSRERFEQDPESSFETLAHEYVHIMDYVKNPIKFILGYLFPQWLSIFSIIAVLAFLSPWFLLFLGFLICLAPLPAAFRRNIEVRGYKMNMLLRELKGQEVSAEEYVHHFTGPEYYFMWPFKNDVIKKLNECRVDELYKDVYNII